MCQQGMNRSVHERDGSIRPDSLEEIASTHETAEKLAPPGYEEKSIPYSK